MLWTILVGVRMHTQAREAQSLFMGRARKIFIATVMGEQVYPLVARCPGYGIPYARSQALIN